MNDLLSTIREIALPKVKIDFVCLLCGEGCPKDEIGRCYTDGIVCEVCITKD